MNPAKRDLRSGKSSGPVWSGDAYTYRLKKVDRIFRVTRERVRQIEAKAVKKLQHPVRSKQLENLLAFGRRLSEPSRPAAFPAVRGCWS
jgi:DNA-directed RNA polymerase, sigma subunit (sigma70/sigma32)